VALEAMLDLKASAREAGPLRSKAHEVV